MTFERWEGTDRWGLFVWQRRLYVVPVHPFANIMDGHRAEAIRWSPRAVAEEAFLARDVAATPLAGPFPTRATAILAANGRQVRQRFLATSGGGP